MFDICDSRPTRKVTDFLHSLLPCHLVGVFSHHSIYNFYNKSLFNTQTDRTQNDTAVNMNG